MTTGLKVSFTCIWSTTLFDPKGAFALSACQSY